MPKLRPLALVLSLTLVAGLTAHDADAAKKKRAPAKKAAPAATACTDFYSFTNKDWLAGNTIVGGSGSVSAMSQLYDLAQQQQRDLLNAAMQSPQNNVQKLLGDFWASGLDEAAVERDGANPIAPLLSRIDGIKRAKDIPPSIAALHQVGIPVAFNFSADIDLADLGRHIGYFTQGGIGLTDPAYYTRTDADSRALLARYNNYVQKILALTGTPADKLAAQAQLVIDLETRIAQVSKPVALLRDPRANYALVPTKDLGKTYKRLQLGDFIQAQGVKDDSVSLANPALFAQLDALINGLKPEQWKAYLRFHVGDAMAPYLAKSFRDAEFEFRGRVLRGQTAQPARQQLVLEAINSAAGPMLGREYVGRYLPAATRSRAEGIANEVRDALGRAVERSTWMSEPTKAEAKAKLSKLKIEIGAPRRDLDYSVQPMGRGSFGGNMLIASTWQHREEMKRIGRGNADRRWDVLPQNPALAYDIAQNRLIVTAAVLQAPVLDMAQDAANHYGTYGAMVGHELGRSIDKKGRLVNAAGELKTWWTPADDSAWDARIAPLSMQYSGYAYPDLKDVRVNGAQTLEENAADLAGVELAWDALSTAQPSLALPSKQAFFQGWAQLWRQQMSADVATRNAATSVHAPGKWRANGPLINQPAFGEAFSCTAATTGKGAKAKKGAPPPMQLPAEQQVSIWR
ncbi:M13 family metallopeptidase [Luteimonas aquatica]|uniref:M13 family metallopeptidase n=1 Tax=Luteimonas aquatica TaxID=450364 RepID=UPI001F599209|nr:M13 family metallopeptidase [Luteimonas aquatica]